MVLGLARGFFLSGGTMRTTLAILIEFVLFTATVYLVIATGWILAAYIGL